MSKSPSLKRVNSMRSPFGDQPGKLSNPEVSCVVDPSSRFIIRSPYSDPFQKRYTIRLPSGDQLGNPLFPSLLVSSWSSEPSGRISMTRAGLPRGGKYNPRPKAIQSSLGDHCGASARVPSSPGKISLAFVPSASITDTEGIATKPVPRLVTASFFPSCEYAGNGAESASSNSESMLNNRRFWGHAEDHF